MNGPYSRRRRRLRGVVDLLLDERSSREALDDAAAELYDVFSAIGVPGNSADSALPSGIALSPQSAATCTRDGLRTAIFVRGLCERSAERRGGFPGELI